MAFPLSVRSRQLQDELIMLRDRRDTGVMVTVCEMVSPSLSQRDSVFARHCVDTPACVLGVLGPGIRRLAGELSASQ